MEETPAERLRLARERAGFKTATEAARHHGWAPSTYMGHENGSRAITVEAAKKYAGRFNIDWAWLLGRPGNGDHLAPVAIPVRGKVGLGYWRDVSATSTDLSEVYVGLPDFSTEALGAYLAADYEAANLRLPSANALTIYIVEEVSSPAVMNGDELVARRRKGSLEELTLWRVEQGKQSMLALTNRGVVSRRLTFDEFDRQGTEVVGVVVAELSLRHRALFRQLTNNGREG